MTSSARRHHTTRLARSLAVLACLLVAMLGSAAQASALVGSTPDATVSLSGTGASAIAQSGGRTFVGGNFALAGTATPRGIDMSLADGSANPAFASPNGTVDAVVADGAGGWYIGGTFTAVGSFARTRIAHLLASGSVDPNFVPSVDATVRALALSGSTLYAGGDFNAAGSPAVTRHRLAAFSTATGALTGFDPNVDDTVRSVAVSGSTVFAGGQFHTINGSVTRNYVAGFDATTGTATSFDARIATNFPATPGQADQNGVNTIGLSGSTLFVGGAFTTVNSGTARLNAAAFDATTAAPTAFDPQVSKPVNSLVVAGSVVYVAGSFTTVNGATARNQVAAVSASTGAATSFAIPAGVLNAASGSVVSMAVAQGTLYVVGDFSGSGRNRAAAFDATTGALTSFDPSFDASVNALAVAGGRGYFGGTFTFVRPTSTTPQPRLRALLADGTLDPAFQPQIDDGQVNAVAVSGGKVYVAGSFTSVNGGVTRNRIAAFDATTGALDPDFDPNIGDGTVFALVVSGNRVYAGGTFSMVNDATTVHGLAAFDTAAGTDDPNFNAQTDNVYALALTASKLYVGGDFTSIGVKTRGRLAAVDPTTGATDATFDPNMNGEVEALAVSGSRVFAGGTFTTVNGAIARNRLAAVDATTGAVDPAFNAPITDVGLAGVGALAVTGDAVYAGGSFTASSGGASRANLAAFDPATGGLLTTFNPNPTNPLGPTVGALTASGTHLYAGGKFVAIGGAPQVGFARFTEATSLPPTPVTGAASAITNTTATLAGTVNPGGAAATYSFEYGTSTSFGANTPFASAGSGSSPSAVSTTLTGLSPDTTYFYRLVAKDGAGTSYFGSVLTFDTGPGGAPVVSTGVASAVSASGATLAGTVDPHGAQTAFVFEYGPTLSFGSISAIDNAGAGNGARSVSLPVSGLAAHTTYYYRLVATNPVGTTFGVVRSFNSGGTALAPSVTTLDPTATGATSATLAAHVNPNGQQTAFTFEYGTTTSFGSMTTVVALDSAIADEPVSAVLTGLSPGTTYLYRVVATNATGTTAGTVHSFTTASST